MKHIRSGENGVTTIESLLSIAIISLIALIIVSILIFSQAAWADSLINVNLYAQAKQPMQEMIKELKEADVSSPIGITISPDQRIITFAIPSTVSSNAVTSWQQVSYSHDPSTRQITRTATTSSIIGRSVSNLNFSRSGDVIVVSLTTQGTSANGRSLSLGLVSQATMRN